MTLMAGTMLEEVSFHTTDLKWPVTTHNSRTRNLSSPSPFFYYRYHPRPDFTKKYNRLRQQLQPGTSATAVVSAPAANVPRKAPSAAAAAAAAKRAEVAQQKGEDSLMLGDQIEALSTKFEGRIHLGDHVVTAPVPEIKVGGVGSKKAAGDR